MHDYVFPKGRSMTGRIPALAAGAVILIAVNTNPAAPDTGDLERAPGTVAVERDSLESIVELLSIDTSTTELRTRYSLREAEMEDVAGLLAGRLDALASSSVSVVPFLIERHFASGDTTFISWNIVADLDLCGDSGDLLMLTAHYDATGSRTAGWSNEWQTASAPGADDNGTGVAAVLEIARCLQSEDLPFDLRIVFFSGEELDRLGSIDFVSRCDDACAEKILGVINMDMIGYSGAGRGVTVMSDEFSGWLAYIIEDVAGKLHPDLPVTVIRPGPWNWDHASFWEKTGIAVSAVTLAEPLGEGGRILYPYYHTVDDVMENVDFDQATEIARLVEDLISGVKDSPPEIAVFDTDIIYYLNGVEMSGRRFAEGDPVTVAVKVRNIGAASGTGGQVALTVNLETVKSSSLLYEGDMEIPGPFRTADVFIDLGEGQAGAGGNMIRASISTYLAEDDPSNNTALSVFSIEALSGGLAGHNFRPNPVEGNIADAMFCVNLETDADMHVEILTLEGEFISSANLGYGFGVPLNPGYSCFRCGDIFNGIERLVSGVYIYRISLFAVDGEKAEYLGRFAVVN